MKTVYKLCEYDYYTGETLTIDELDPIPPGYTEVPPPNFLTGNQYAKYIGGQEAIITTVPPTSNVPIAPIGDHATTLRILWSFNNEQTTNKKIGVGAGISYPPISPENSVTQLVRTSFNTGKSTYGSSGIMSINPIVWRGVSGLGGFYLYCRFALESYHPTERIFIGLDGTPISSLIEDDPSTNLDVIGIVKDKNDNELSIIESNNVSFTKHNTGILPGPDKVLDFSIFCESSSDVVYTSLWDPFTNHIYVNNLALNATLPDANTVFYVQALIQSTSSKVSKQLSISELYVAGVK